ncbi:hypothetical protein [Solidesulfovibrio sp. C21]|uniref:hypothetical protein n=1 Tax=Solidesulfovibrio sp. C21 TaxID=3398613 RepID=UPI0039FCB61D
MERLAYRNGEFEVTFAYNEQTKRNELSLTSKASGRRFAKHTHFNLLDEHGELLEVKPITEDIAQFILNNFEIKGDTESFSIFKTDLEQGTIDHTRKITLRPQSILHKITKSENNYTATGAKLHYHWPIFKKFKETGFGSIIRATLTLHQKCSSRCHYCSTISRNKSDSITLDEAKRFVDKLYSGQALFNKKHFPEYNELYQRHCGSDIRVRGIILSGGGQPNLWPHFAEFVQWLSGLDIDLGLITNGFPKSVPEEIYNSFKWIRISITPEDASPFYPDQRFDKQYLPATILHNDKVTVGYSYVVGAWTDDEIFTRINRSLDENGFRYCRVLADCNLTREMQLKSHEMLSKRLLHLGLIAEDGQPLGRIFHQLKYHGYKDDAMRIWERGQCYVQTYNVFWDTTDHDENKYSYCYPCDSVTVLTDTKDDGGVIPSARRFNHAKWGTVKNTEVEKLYTEPVKPFFDPRQRCLSCLFMRNNKTILDMMNSNTDFLPVSTELDHVNFP